jgi:hypothetical protein
MPKMEPIFPFDEITIPPAKDTTDEALRAALNLGNENPFYINKAGAKKAEAPKKPASGPSEVGEP